MAATTNQAVWGLLWYLRHNPHKSIEAMNDDDVVAAAKLWMLENAIDSATTEADPLAYGTITFPKTDTTAGSGISAAAVSQAICVQAHYPETHRSGG